MSSEIVQQILVALEHLQFTCYLHVSALCLIVYEYSITLDSEIKHIWGSHWGFMKILYIIARYLPFVDTSLFLLRHFLPHPSTQTCFSIFRATSWILLGGICLTEVIFTLRTWALCERKKWLTVCLPLFFVALWTCDMYSAGKALSAVQFGLQGVIPRGCIISGGDTTPIWINWALLLLYDFVNLALMFIPALKTFKRKGMSQVTKVIFRDGIIYYIYIFIISLANLLVAVTLPSDYFDIIIALGRDIHAILACRVILNARELDYIRRTQTIARPAKSGFWD